MSGSISSRFALLVSKFRGCLVGSLVGDCMGALAEVQQLFTPASMTAAADTHLPANSMSSMTNSQDGKLHFKL